MSKSRFLFLPLISVLNLTEEYLIRIYTDTPSILMLPIKNGSVNKTIHEATDYPPILEIKVCLGKQK